MKFPVEHFNVLYFIICISISAACHHTIKSSSSDPESNQSTTFKNPVFEPILADPSIICTDDGWFYAYGTQDDWGDGAGSRIVPIIRSRDLVQWEYRGTAFDEMPGWKEKGGIWAPCIAQVDGKYHLYYSYSIWADPDPGVGLAVADSPDGPFEDLGKIYLSSEVGIANGIDPFYIEEGGKKYLFAGSYNTGDREGIHAFELMADGRKIKEPSEKIKISAGDFEAVMIHRRGKYFYFFGSKGGCCDGEKSTYEVRVARSENLFGPYLDREGNSILDRGNGTLLIRGNEIFAGPGHNARITTDKEGKDWFLYHAILKSDPRVISGANRRSLMLDPLHWDKDGWPYINGNRPDTTSQPAPVF